MEKKWRKNWEKGKLSRGRVNILGKGKASFFAVRYWHFALGTGTSAYVLLAGD